MNSQTIGNQTSSFRTAAQENLPLDSHMHPKKFGIHVTGIPLTEKVGRMEQFMSGNKAPHLRTRLPDLWHNAKFHLHYYQWSSVKETTGEGVYTFNEETDLGALPELMNGSRID